MTVTLEDLNGTINWIKDYFDKTGLKNAILGLSGGIDSAVTASLCCRALGKRNFIGVILPCYSQRIDERLAEKLAGSLGVETIHMDLEDTFDHFWKNYRLSSNEPCMPDQYNKLVPANIKARLRMTALYAIAGHASGLVVGTTNKTESLLGYATKYGDGGVDIEPIQDFYKGEIYELAKLLNDIPQEIIDRAPTAGLWDGQTDEDELGIKYPEIDLCIRAITKDFETPDQEIAITEARENRMDKIHNICIANKHKSIGLPYYKRES